MNAVVPMNAICPNVRSEKLWNLYLKEKRNPHFLRFLTTLLSAGFDERFNCWSFANQIFPNVHMHEGAKVMGYSKDLCVAEATQLSEKQGKLFLAFNDLVDKTELFGVYFGKIGAKIQEDLDTQNFRVSPENMKYHLVEEVKEFVFYEDHDPVTKRELYSIYLEIENALHVLAEQLSMTVDRELRHDDILIKRREKPAPFYHHGRKQHFLSYFEIRFPSDLPYQQFDREKPAKEVANVISNVMVFFRYILKNGEKHFGKLRVQSSIPLPPEDKTEEWTREICHDGEPFFLSDFVRVHGWSMVISDEKLLNLYKPERWLIHQFLNESGFLLKKAEQIDRTRDSWRFLANYAAFVFDHIEPQFQKGGPFDDDLGAHLKRLHKFYLTL